MKNWKKNWKKNLAKVNLTIDAIMLILLMAISGLGLLMKYILLPGFKRNEVYGRDVELYFWKLTRHDWGNIHFWLSVAFLFLLLLHIIFHWKLILGIFRRMFSVKPLRIVIATFIGLASIFLAFSPLAIKPEVGPSDHEHSHDHQKYTKQGQGKGRNAALPLSEKDFSEIPEEKSSFQSENNDHKDIQQMETEHSGRRRSEQVKIMNDIEVFGSMTLKEVAEKYNISAAELAEAMGIPGDQTEIRLGLLKRRYNFSMTDIKIAAQKIYNSKK